MLKGVIKTYTVTVQQSVDNTIDEMKQAFYVDDSLWNKSIHKNRRNKLVISLFKIDQIWVISGSDKV